MLPLQRTYPENNLTALTVKPLTIFKCEPRSWGNVHLDFGGKLSKNMHQSPHAKHFKNYLPYLLLKKC